MRFAAYERGLRGLRVRVSLRGSPSQDTAGLVSAVVVRRRPARRDPANDAEGHRRSAFQSHLAPLDQKHFGVRMSMELGPDSRLRVVACRWLLFETVGGGSLAQLNWFRLSASLIPCQHQSYCNQQ